MCSASERVAARARLHLARVLGILVVADDHEVGDVARRFASSA